MDYNQTVHLPQTDFPMRAGLPKREPEMLQEMYDHDLYHKMVKRNEGKPTFVLHDGPPYANGNIHIGTALNKVRGERVPQGVRMQRLIDVRTLPRSPDDFPNRLSRQSFSSFIQK